MNVLKAYPQRQHLLANVPESQGLKPRDDRGRPSLCSLLSPGGPFLSASALNTLPQSQAAASTSPSPGAHSLRCP